MACRFEKCTRSSNVNRPDSKTVGHAPSGGDEIDACNVTIRSSLVMFPPTKDDLGFVMVNVPTSKVETEGVFEIKRWTTGL